jgi:hypothetical protein
MASFTLRAGAFEGVAGSSSLARERGGAFVVVDLVRFRSGRGVCMDEEPEGLALEEIVRGRAEGDFGTRRVEGEAVKNVEGSVTRAPTRREFAGRVLALETGRRDFKGFGELVPLEEDIARRT